ncbi:hypothetical protein BDZ97DRAFT_1918346 [Flammula alnicola]|nr:hypothetical protein BDZ97DRAFT_1918346 [Flammula alnicola]
MSQESEKIYAVPVPPVGTAIQCAADMVMSLIERERQQAAQKAEAHFSHLRRYLEEYRRLSEANQKADASTIALCQQRIRDLEAQLIKLQNLKQTDDAALLNLSNTLDSLQQERDYLQLELSVARTDEENKNLEEQKSRVVQDFQSHLVPYGIYSDKNLLSFRGQWWALWKEFGAAESMAQICPPTSL